MALFSGFDVLCARLDRGHHHAVGVAHISGIDHLALAFKHEADAAGFAQVAAVLCEGAAHIAGGPVAVVGHRLDDHGHAIGAIPLIADFLVIIALTDLRFLDRPIDHILGHGLRFGLFDGHAQARVFFGIGIAHLGRNGDLLAELRKQLGAHGVLASLAVLDICPFGMAGHVRSLLLKNRLPNNACCVGEQRYWHVTLKNNCVTSGT